MCIQKHNGHFHLKIELIGFNDDRWYNLGEMGAI